MLLAPRGSRTCLAIADHRFMGSQLCSVGLGSSLSEAQEKTRPRGTPMRSSTIATSSLVNGVDERIMSRLPSLRLPNLFSMTQWLAERLLDTRHVPPTITRKSSEPLAGRLAAGFRCAGTSERAPQASRTAYRASGS